MYGTSHSSHVSMNQPSQRRSRSCSSSASSPAIAATISVSGPGAPTGPVSRARWWTGRRPSSGRGRLGERRGHDGGGAHGAITPISIPPATSPSACAASSAPSS